MYRALLFLLFSTYSHLSVTLAQSLFLGSRTVGARSITKAESEYKFSVINLCPALSKSMRRWTITLKVIDTPSWMFGIGSQSPSLAPSRLAFFVSFARASSRLFCSRAVSERARAPPFVLSSPTPARPLARTRRLRLIDPSPPPLHFPAWIDNRPEINCAQAPRPARVLR